MPFRLLVPTALALACAAASPASAQRPPDPRGQAGAGQAVPASTGDSGCDAAAAAWRACIAASPKAPEDKLLANREVDKFVRDVLDARGPHRASLTGACPRTAEGYRRMIEQGACARNVTGARDDAASRAAIPSRADMRPPR